MKRWLILPALLLSFVVAGCSGDSVFRGGTSLTASVTNPVGKKELQVVYNTYLIAGNSYIRYRNLGICQAGTSFTLAKPCADRGVLLSIQAKDRTAYAALKTAGVFVKNNPNVSALSLVNAARSAVTDFQNAIPSTGVN